MNHRRLLPIPLALAALALAHCDAFQTDSLNGTVVGFGHAESAGTFAFRPVAGQSESLEWHTYCNLVACLLEQQGLTLAATPEAAQRLVEIEYSIDGGTPVTETAPIYGQTGIGMPVEVGNADGSGFSVEGIEPSLGQIGSVPITQTIYTSALTLRIFNAPSAAQATPAWEARVTSKGLSNELAAVLPTMILHAFAPSAVAGGGTAVSWDAPPTTMADAMAGCKGAHSSPPAPSS